MTRSALVVLALVVAAAGVGACRDRRAIRRRCGTARAPGSDPAPLLGPGAARPDASPGRHPPPVDRPIRRLGRRWIEVEVLVGRSVRRRLHRPAGAGAGAGVDADRRVGRALVVAGAIALVGVGLLPAVAAGFAVWAVPLIGRVTRRSRRRGAILDEAPEIVDLIRLGVGSGLNVRLALDAVVRHHDGLIAGELRAVLARVDRGARLADALDAVDREIEPVRPLVDALVATERYGAPLVASLDRVASDARTARRRTREEAARRVPVKLLFPLVFCTLPAFALLTVVPVLLRSLPSVAP